MTIEEQAQTLIGWSMTAMAFLSIGTLAYITITTSLRKNSKHHSTQVMVVAAVMALFLVGAGIIPWVLAGSDEWLMWTLTAVFIALSIAWGGRWGIHRFIFAPISKEAEAAYRYMERILLYGFLFNLVLLGGVIATTLILPVTST